MREKAVHLPSRFAQKEDQPLKLLGKIELELLYRLQISLIRFHSSVGENKTEYNFDMYIVV